MNRYTFKVHRTIYTTLTVEAENEDDAHDRAVRHAIATLAEDFPETLKSRQQNTEIDCVAEEPLAD